MKTRQREEIRRQLRAHGWEVCAVEDCAKTPAADAWYLVELWQIRSRWTPVGAELFISFVIDPAYDIQAKDRWRGVWLVTGSRQRPANQRNQDDEVGLVVSKGWRNRLPAFIAGVNQLRSSNNPEVTMDTQFDEFDEQFFHATDEQTA
ncbi:MAG: hypothetical protein HOP19_08835 [Acidobacteria bacterium]|nr:hypothetical protein [Acidobacteriota bacterium]